jgi:hypothetical protein
LGGRVDGLFVPPRRSPLGPGGRSPGRRVVDTERVRRSNYPLGV